ncbi:hypothetical protein PYCC9005_005874 [Savitreella phatthalungensis]
MSKSACFDVLGTCFDFEGAIAVINERLGEKLAAHKVDARTLFFSWFYATQRDFTYCSIAGAYQPIATIFSKTFRRACEVVDVPGKIASDEDIAAVMSAIRALQPRPGLKQCYEQLRAAGFDVYAVTNGGFETSMNYYRMAGIELDDDHLLSCDTIQKAKPDPLVYETSTRHITARGCSDSEKWFVAAHSWDLIAARKAGYKTAWIAWEEHDPVIDVFGKFDIYAKDFDDLLEQITKSS